MPSLFIGLGPRGEAMTEEEIKAKLEESVPIIALRKRGTCAFADVADEAQADKLIREMNGQYIGEARLAVQMSKDKRNGPRRDDRDDRRGEDRRDDRDRDRRRRDDSRDKRRDDSRDKRRRDDSRDKRRDDSRDRRRRRSPSN